MAESREIARESLAIRPARPMLGEEPVAGLSLPDAAVACGARTRS